MLLVSIEKLPSFLPFEASLFGPFNVMEKSGSGKESWIIRLDSLVSMSWPKLMDWSSQFPAPRNATPIVTPMKCVLCSRGERGMWEETPSGKAQVEEEITCAGAACARRDVDTIVFYGHIKGGGNHLLIPGPDCMPAASRNSDQATNR